MGTNLQYIVNIAMEVTILIVLLIMFITVVWQKGIFKTTIPLIFLLSNIILLTIVQIITWLFLIMDLQFTYGVLPMRIVFILDFIFSYGMTVAFYCYLEALATDEYHRIGVAFTPNKYIKNAIIVWGIVITIIYSVALFIPSTYHLEGDRAVFSVSAYIALHIVTKFACACALIFVIKHREIIGKYEVAISIAFLIMVSILVVIDELYSVCIGHLFAAIFIFVLYVRIDLHKGLLLERQEKEITLWKTQIMLSQMQPHFLYNVLTTISGMCEMENAIEARDVVNHFADYFRTNLESLGKENMISFEKELEHIKTYLWLEKVRFEDSLNICYEIETTDFSLPSLTVQPIVENAVKHGVLPKDGMGTVIVRTFETSRDYVIVVEDDGVGFENNECEDSVRTHIGIDNVTKRLEIICNGTLDIKSEKGKGTVVTIYIPKGDLL